MGSLDDVFLPILTGYLLGATPFAFLLVRRRHGFDLRNAGSGNVGAANVWRTTTRALASAVVALDAAKGAAAVVLWRWWSGDVRLEVVAAVAAVLGHVYPVWLRGRGGKGVATSAGAFALLAPGPTLLGVAIFVGVVAVTRFVSLGSVSSAAALAPIAYGEGAPDAVVAGAAIVGVVVLFRHRGNLARVIGGTERRFGQRV